MQSFFLRIGTALGVLLLIMTLSFWMTRSAPGGPFDQALRLDAGVEANLWIRHGMASKITSAEEGVVSTVEVVRGELVQRHQPLMTLKSGAKMLAPHEGKVIHVLHQVGDTRTAGAPFVVLEDPLWTQYLHAMAGYVTFQFGPSFQYPDRTVESLIAESFPVSMELGFWAFILALLLGVTGGTLAGIHTGRWQDRLTMFLSATLVSGSTLILGPLLLLFFGVYLGWVEWGGWDSAQAKVLPVMTLGLVFAANMARLVRAGVVETASALHVRTARAKGVSEHIVVLKHILPGALIPLLGYLGPALAAILCGSVVVERIFNVPGVSEYFIAGALNRDYPMVMGVVVLYSALLLAMNALLDGIQTWLDPRISEGA